MIEINVDRVVLNSVTMFLLMLQVPCYAPRLTIGCVPNRLPWYYNIADRSSYMNREIYTM